jgi:spore germination cell wall hydrolase CwlJ-like protein
MKRIALHAIIVVSALAFTSVSQAETPEVVAEGQSSWVSNASSSLSGLVGVFTSATPLKKVDAKELQCLSKNIYFEAGIEPIEGKVAVGLVTLNRVNDGRFGGSVCDVVDQKTVKEVTSSRVVETPSPVVTGVWIFTRTVTIVNREVVNVVSRVSVCQFSWRCNPVKTPKKTDARWVESQRVAHELLAKEDAYPEVREKYNDALYFHSGARPIWAKMKSIVGRIGGHYFYSEREEYARN